MKQFDLQGNEYDIQLRDMIEPIENWQYVSGTRDIGKSYFQNLLNEKDEEIERLKEDNEYLNKVNIELSTEKNRLNNIINELEKYIVIKLKEFNTPEEYYTLKQIDDIHYRLQELKGSDKE